MERDFNHEDTLKSKLETINPDTWNNIPICIVDGIKYLSEFCLVTMKDLNSLVKVVDENDKRQRINNTTFVNQLSSSESKLKTKLSDVERLSRKFADDAMAFVRDRSDLLDKQSKGLSEKVDKSISEVEDKISKMDETEHIMNIVKEEIKSQIDTEVSRMIIKAKDDIKQYIDEMFIIPGIIGPKEISKGITDFIKLTKSGIDNCNLDISTKITEVKEIITQMKEQSEVEEERREKLNKQKLEHAAKEMAQEQQKSFEEMKSAIERLVRENNLDIDVRFKGRLDNLKDQNEIDIQNIKKTENDQLKLITTLQQKVYDISDYKLKDAIDASKEASEKVNELKLKMQDFIFKNENGDGERINQLSEKFEALQDKIEDILSNKKFNISGSKFQQSSVNKLGSNKPAPVDDLIDDKSSEINKEENRNDNDSEETNSEEEKAKKREARRIAVFPVHKDPQKVLHHKIKEGVKLHSDNKFKEFENMFREESPLRVMKTVKNDEKMKSTASKAISINENLRSISPDLPTISDK